MKLAERTALVTGASRGIGRCASPGQGSCRQGDYGQRGGARVRGYGNGHRNPGENSLQAARPDPNAALWHV